MRIPTLAAICATAAIVACSNAGPQAAGTFESRTSYDRLFGAAMAATPVVGFHTTNVSRSEGLITAEQNVVMGRGNAVAMTVSITKQPHGNLLTVSFIAPPGTFTMGNFDQNVDEYIAALRGTVPDLQAAR